MAKGGEIELEKREESTDSELRGWFLCMKKKDGFINQYEFSSLCRSSSDAITAASELRDAFDLYDQDKNGLISANELHRVLNRLGMKCSVDDCVRMIKSVDSDGDGNVNFEEFEKMMGASLSSNDNGSKP